MAAAGGSQDIDTEGFSFTVEARQKFLTDKHSLKIKKSSKINHSVTQICQLLQSQVENQNKVATIYLFGKKETIQKAITVAEIIRR